MGGLADWAAGIAMTFSNLAGAEFHPKNHDVVIDFGVSNQVGQELVGVFRNDQLEIRGLDSTEMLNGEPNVIYLNDLKDIEGLQTALLDIAADSIGSGHGGPFLETIEPRDLGDIKHALQATLGDVSQSAAAGFESADPEIKAQYEADLAKFYEVGDAIQRVEVAGKLPAISESVLPAIQGADLSAQLQGQLIETWNAPAEGIDEIGLKIDELGIGGQ